MVRPGRTSRRTLVSMRCLKLRGRGLPAAWLVFRIERFQYRQVCPCAGLASPVQQLAPTATRRQSRQPCRLGARCAEPHCERAKPVPDHVRLAVGGGRWAGRLPIRKPTYVSPTDSPTIGPRVPREDALEHLMSDIGDESRSEGEDEDRASAYESSSETGGRRLSLESPSLEHNPPTPNLLDISMHSLPRRQAYFSSSYRQGNGANGGQVEYLDVRIRKTAMEKDSGSGESGESDATARRRPGWLWARRGIRLPLPDTLHWTRTSTEVNPVAMMMDVS